jgi:drug/metabolite transporter (DMT)-like permease
MAVLPSPAAVEPTESARRSPEAALVPPIAPASVLLLLAAMLFATMAVVAKATASALPGPEVAFVRFCVGLVACGLAATRIRMRTSNKLGLVMRGLYGGGAVLLYFLAIEHLPVGVATLLNYTAPVFTALYAAAFLGEPVRPATVGALAVTTAGVALVLVGTAPEGTLGIGVWQMVGIGSAVLAGAAVATIREVRKTDGSWEIFAALCFGGALVTAGPTALRWVPPSPVQWTAIVAVGLLSLVAQLLLTYALRFIRAAVAGIITMFTPVGALAMGWFFLGESIAGLALVGAAVTLAGVSWGAYQASSSAEPGPVEEP